MKKIKSILIVLIIGTIFANIVIAATTDNQDNAQPEDITLYINEYQPKVVSQYDLETPNAIGQGNYYTVYAILKGILTNPTIDIPKINSISISANKEGSNYVSSIVHFAPIQRTYSMNNMGYLVINLNKNSFKSGNIPDTIDVPVKATIKYQQDYGYGVFPEDVILKEINEKDFLAQKSIYSFWNNRGYLRLEKLENGQAIISVYNNKLIKTNTFNLASQSISNQFSLTRDYTIDNSIFNVANTARIKYQRVVGGEKSIRLQMIFNNQLQFIDRFVGEQLYDGSSWKIKSITSSNSITQVQLQNSDNNEIITLKRNPKSTVQCELFDSITCLAYTDKCKVVNDKCLSINSQESTAINKNEQEQLVKEITNSYNNYNFIGRQKSIISRLDSATMDVQLTSVGSDLDKLANDYFEFMNKYPSNSNPYYDVARRLLAVSNSNYKSVLEMYSNVISRLSDETIKASYQSKLNDIKTKVINLGVSLNQDSTISTISLSSKEYYQNAIISYQNVVDKYQNSKDNEVELAPKALNKIAGIYQYNLYNIPKAIEAYRSLLTKFANTNYVKAEFDSINQEISILQNSQNYDINYEQIVENGNIISLSLNDITTVGNPSKVSLQINDVPRDYGVGDSLNSGNNALLTNWVVTEINSDNIVVSNIIDANPQKITIKVSGQYSIAGSVVKVNRINSQSLLLVTVLPGLQNTYSVTNFNIHIPIDKRVLQLTPEEIDKEIALTQKTIDSFNAVTSKVDKFNTLYKGYCYTTFATLYTKNLFTNPTQLKARQEVTSKWKSYCQDASITGYGKQYSNVQQCQFANSQAIESDVQKAQDIIKDVQAKVKSGEIPANEEESSIKQQLFVNSLSNTETPSSVKQAYADDFYTEDRNAKITKQRDTKITTISSSFFDNSNKLLSNINLEDIKAKYPNLEIDYPEDFAILQSSKSQDEKQAAAQDILNRESTRLVNQYNVDYKGINSYSGELQTNVYAITFFEKINDVSIAGLKDSNALTQIYLGSITYKTIDGKNYYYDSLTNQDLYTSADLNTKLTSQPIVGTKYYKKDISGKSSEIMITSTKPKENFIPLVSISQDSNTKGRIQYLSVDPYHYIEVTQRLSNGQISKIRLIQSYSANDISHGGSVYVRDFDYDQTTCKKELDHLYSTTDPSTGSTVLQPVLNGKNACELLSAAELANNKKLYDPSKDTSMHLVVNGITLGNYKVQSAAAKQSGLDCIDIYSVDECRLLAGACDPVLCPASRFNMGGRFQVDNVIQTGIAGGLMLGLSNYDPPYEPLPVCLTGVNAGLKNVKSIFEGYQQCLIDKKTKGEMIGGCSYIRRLGFCEVVWGTATSMTSAFGGVDNILKSALTFGAKSFSSTGNGNEYSNFQDNFKRSNEFASYFTSTYKDNVLAAYKGKATNEIGTEICKAAIYGKLPGQGSLVDQFLKPSTPSQFFATYDEVPYADVTGVEKSTYRVIYNVYAGEDKSINYRLFLNRDSDGARQYITYTTNLEVGRVDQKTVDVQAEKGFNQICIIIDNTAPKCGFGKVSTEFAIQYAQEQAINNQYSKVATNAAECLSQASNTLVTPDAQTTALNLVGGTGITQTGIRRVCQTINPGLGTINENNWVQRGTCGKDSSGIDLGTCWLDINSVNLTDIKNQQALTGEIGELIKNVKSDDEVISLLNKLVNSKIKSDTQLNNLLTTIRTAKTSTEVSNEEKSLKSLESNYWILFKQADEITQQTITENILGVTYYNIGNIFESLGSLKKNLENIKSISESKGAIKKPSVAVTPELAKGSCIQKTQTDSEGVSLPIENTYDCTKVSNRNYLSIPNSNYILKASITSSYIGTVKTAKIEVYNSYGKICSGKFDFDMTKTETKTCDKKLEISFTSFDEFSEPMTADFTVKVLSKEKVVSKCKLQSSDANNYVYLCTDLINDDFVRLSGTALGIRAKTSYPTSVNLELYNPDRVKCGGSILGFSLNSNLEFDASKKSSASCNKIATITLSPNTEKDSTKITLQVKLLSDVTKLSAFETMISTITIITGLNEPSDVSKGLIRKYSSTITTAVKQGDPYLSPSLLAAMITQESGEYGSSEKRDPIFATSTGGAAGIAQFLSATARDNGLIVRDDYGCTKKIIINENGKEETYCISNCHQYANEDDEKNACLGKDPIKDERFDPKKSINAMASYLRSLGNNPNTERNEEWIIAAYNAGPGKVAASKICSEKREFECPTDPQYSSQAVEYLAKVEKFKNWYENDPEFSQLLKSDLIASSISDTNTQTAASINPEYVQPANPEFIALG